MSAKSKSPTYFFYFFTYVSSRCLCKQTFHILVKDCSLNAIICCGAVMEYEKQNVSKVMEDHKSKRLSSEESTKREGDDKCS